MGQNLLNTAVALHEACMSLPDAQRVALANALIRTVQDEHCVLQLRGLSTVASETAHELARRTWMRRAG
jgi:hypothetical protein